MTKNFTSPEKDPRLLTEIGELELFKRYLHQCDAV